MRSENFELRSSSQASEVAHFLITRFGIGQSKNSFYEANMPFLRVGLASSLKAQSNQNFLWIVIVDANCPIWVSEELVEIQETISQLTIIQHDPWAEMSMMPDFLGMLRHRVAPGQTVLTTRVDHDDALAGNFNEVVLKRVESLAYGGDLGVAVSYPRGVGYFVRSKTALAMIKPDYSVVSMLSKFGRNFTDCYKENHTQFFRDIPGRRALSIDIGEPLWMRVIRPNSSHKLGHRKLSTELGDSYPLLRIPHSFLKRARSQNFRTLYYSVFPNGNISKVFGVDSVLFAEIKATPAEQLDLGQRKFLESLGIGVAQFSQFAVKERILQVWRSRLSQTDISDESLNEAKNLFYSL